MAKRVFLHFVCALLLLVAQHGALTHSVWHLHDHFPAHEQHDPAGAAHQHEDDEHSSQSRLCDLHFALGTLLAGDCGAQPVLATTVLSRWLATSGADWRIAQPAATPPSRAPPVLH